MLGVVKAYYVATCTLHVEDNYHCLKYVVAFLAFKLLSVDNSIRYLWPSDLREEDSGKFILTGSAIIYSRFEIVGLLVCHDSVLIHNNRVIISSYFS